MIVECGHCDVTVTITLTTTGYQWRVPALFSAQCPVLAEKLNDQGHLSGDDQVCPHLSEAMGLAAARRR